MQPEKKELPKLYIEQPGGSRVIIGKVQSAEIITDEYPDLVDFETGNFFYPPKTATFEVRWNPTIDTIHLLIYGKLPTNNWRKMHGFPLRRKVR